jgi:AMMECR1 domain-containing protein
VALNVDGFRQEIWPMRCLMTMAPWPDKKLKLARHLHLGRTSEDKRRDLRGCRGTVMAYRPLIDDLTANAVMVGPG